MKNKVVFFANCQGNALGKTLIECDEFNAKYELVLIPPVHMIKDNTAQYVIDAVSECDLFIYQNVKESNVRPKNINSSYLLSIIKSDAKSISIPSIYFDAFFPHLGGINGWPSPLNLLHDYNVAYCYYIGLSVEQTIDVINSNNFYTSKKVYELLENSISSLKEREVFHNLDIKVSNFIINNYRKKYLMHQFNHPTRVLLNFVAESILHLIDIQYILPASGAEYLGFASPKIYPSILLHNKINISTEMETYCGPQGRIDEKRCIQEYFTIYEKQDNEMLLEAIKKKPFVINKVERVLKNMNFSLS
tara:strand:+ start:19782 stop:20696 length:915 start_codon:yes stop_codon:yes gene_type:complete